MYITISTEWEDGCVFEQTTHKDMSQEDLVTEILYIATKYMNYTSAYMDPEGHPKLHEATLIRCSMEECGHKYTFIYDLRGINFEVIRDEVGYYVLKGFKELKEKNMGILHTGSGTGHTLYARATGQPVYMEMSRWDPFKITAGEMPAPKIKKVIVAYPATIVFFDDKTKVVVKCQGDDVFDPEKGIAIAVMRKLYPKKYGDILSMKDKKITYVTEHNHYIETYKTKTKKK